MALLGVLSGYFAFRNQGTPIQRDSAAFSWDLASASVAYRAYRKHRAVWSKALLRGLPVIGGIAALIEGGAYFIPRMIEARQLSALPTPIGNPPNVLPSSSILSGRITSRATDIRRRTTPPYRFACRPGHPCSRKCSPRHPGLFPRTLRCLPAAWCTSTGAGRPEQAQTGARVPDSGGSLGARDSPRRASWATCSDRKAHRPGPRIPALRGLLRYTGRRRGAHYARSAARSGQGGVGLGRHSRDASERGMSTVSSSPGSTGLGIGRFSRS